MTQNMHPMERSLVSPVSVKLQLRFRTFEALRKAEIYFYVRDTLVNVSCSYKRLTLEIAVRHYVEYYLGFFYDYPELCSQVIEMPVPYCEQLAREADNSHGIDNFLNWLSESYDIELGAPLIKEGCFDHFENWLHRADKPIINAEKTTCIYAREYPDNCTFAHLFGRREKLLADYFCIDLDLVERERQVLLHVMRVTQEGRDTDLCIRTMTR